MRLYLTLILLFCCCNSFNYTQNRLSINLGPGYYLLNSENSNMIVGDKRFKWYVRFGFAYQKQDILEGSLLFEYSYDQSIKEDALIFARTSEISPDPIGYTGADVSIINHNFDLDYVQNVNEIFSYGFGPSYVITNRVVDIEPLYDKLDLISASFYWFNHFLCQLQRTHC